MGLTNHCENLVNALGYHSDIIFGKPFGAMSARLSHLNNSNGALSADARPQFPTLGMASSQFYGPYEISDQKEDLASDPLHSVSTPARLLIFGGKNKLGLPIY
ncbi:hypothetical protein PtA15_5A93 [Puccinia triticina]|uniref:Uncharacterized protein n=1 Tax=Puccinia triticina TaxID=208348 RepID=A0ABY7CJI9_9BASI|nr:uncharacterized protein PtA15_5A93 [Puccinia triticina]WAQ84523.1 hypothetical protein PtA15_5A93 [Puccinia triticina]